MNLNLAERQYGSDHTGLICGYLFSPGSAGRELDSAEVADWLAQPESATGNEFVWLHFNLTNSSCERWLKANLDLSEFYFEALREGTRSTHIEYADNALVAVVNDVLYEFAFEASDISTLWLSADRRMLVSSRTKPLRSVDKLRAAVKRREAFRSPVELLVHLLRDQADVLVQIVRQTTSRVDSIEDKLLQNRVDTQRADLGALRRVLVRLQRLLAPEPNALFRLLNRPPRWIASEDLQELRQSTEEFAVVLNDLTALGERIKLLQEEIAAQLNEQTNRSLFVLTIVTVLALPINIVAGLLGMNVGGIPLAQHPHGFWVVISLVATVTALAAIWAFRKRPG
ncbi:transporter [Chitinimonas sp.]|uniref:transporter n=1 Tax=Chitinimonas sp. TaxID=1934313 RepID=UPI0035B492CA